MQGLDTSKKYEITVFWAAHLSGVTSYTVDFPDGGPGRQLPFETAGGVPFTYYSHTITFVPVNPYMQFSIALSCEGLDGTFGELYFDDFTLVEACAGTPFPTPENTPTPTPTPADPAPPVCPALTNLIDNSGAKDSSVDNTVYRWVAK